MSDFQNHRQNPRNRTIHTFIKSRFNPASGNKLNRTARLQLSRIIPHKINLNTDNQITHEEVVIPV